MSFVVQQYIEGLCVGSELGALQIAPLVANSAQCALLAVLCNFYGLGQGSLVVHIEGDEDILVVQYVCHLWIAPYGSLHFAAVDAAKARKVNDDGLAFSLCSSHTLFVVRKSGLDTTTIEIEVLGVHGRCESADGLAGSTP